MELRQYAGKRIRVVTDEGGIFEGDCTDYTPPDENESEIASIGVVTEPDAGYAYELYENEIKSITIID